MHNSLPHLLPQLPNLLIFQIDQLLIDKEMMSRLPPSGNIKPTSFVYTPL